MTSADATAAPTRQGAVLRVSGEVDLLTAPELRRRLRQSLAAGHRDVVVDLSAVTFMDCAGLSALLEARAVLGRNLRLRGLPWSLQRILELSGLQGAFTMDAPGAPELDRRAGHSSSRPVRPAGRGSGSLGQGAAHCPAVPPAPRPGLEGAPARSGQLKDNVSEPDRPGPTPPPRTAVGGDACRVMPSHV